MLDLRASMVFTHLMSRLTASAAAKPRQERVSAARHMMACSACRGRDTNSPMELNGTHRFAANRQAVWNALHNSAALQNSIPGAEEVAWQGDSAISLRVKVGVGPINGTFSGQAQVTEQTPPSHLKLSINRRGSTNAVQADVTIDLADEGAGTVLTYHGTARLEGPIAMADNPLTRPLAEGALGQFFNNFAKQIA